MRRRLLGTMLERRGDVAGAKAAWRRAMNWHPTSRNAGAVFIGLVNLLERQQDAGGTPRRVPERRAARQPRCDLRAAATR